jgi:hypothetical protein
VPLCAGAAAYLFVLSAGEMLLRDSHSYWQIKVGQWIIAHGAMPTTDVFWFTRFDATWMSSSWLFQLLLAGAYGSSDWAGPVILPSLALGALVAIFVYLLSAYFDPARAILITALTLLQSGSHLLARPHLLALPVMPAFVGGLLRAADHRALARQPSCDHGCPDLARGRDQELEHHAGMILGRPVSSSWTPTNPTLSRSRPSTNTSTARMGLSSIT